MNRQCKDCEWFCPDAEIHDHRRGIVSGGGECRIETPSNDREKKLWARVHEMDWCSEFDKRKI